MERLGNWTDNPCWYVSVRDAGRTALVLGPFRSAAACREYAYNDSQGAADSEPGGNTAKHYALVLEAEKHDPRSWFYSWGMVKMDNGYKTGVLNKYADADAEAAMRRDYFAQGKVA
jgi:hypothetical protein